MKKGKNPDEKAAKEIAEAAALEGARLATLVSLLNISDEGKDALLYLLEECTMEEVEKVSDVLMALLLEYETKKEDEKFAKEMAKLRARWEAKEDRIVKRSMASLRKLEEALNKKIGIETSDVTDVTIDS